MKKIIPVVVINQLSEVEPTLSALRKGGVNCAEITFRTPVAAEAIALATKTFPNMEIGAGTVVNVFQCQSAIDAGAAFVVSPGLSVEVAKLCADRGVTYYPGCVTPTEIMQALSLGLNVIKFFPAGLYGGVKAIKALSGPFPQVRFIPTGGIDTSNIAEYAACDRVYAIGGSFMLKGDIEANCKEIFKLCE